MKEISCLELHEKLERKEEVAVLDVRPESAFLTGHIGGKGPRINIPYSDIVAGKGQEKLPKEGEVVVACFKGRSAVPVAAYLNERGHQAVILTGGMERWNAFIHRKCIVSQGPFSLYQFLRPSRGCLSYVIVSQKEALVIDPLRNIEPYLGLLRELGATAKCIIDTHAHADHISGGVELAKCCGVPYYLHPYDGIHPIDCLPAKIGYEPAWAERTFRVGSVELKGIHVPGHTLGNMAYLLNGSHLFTGDSIFLRSVARPDLGGQPKAWTPLHYHSLRKLMALSDDVIILPSHIASVEESDEAGVYSMRLGDLKKVNEGLQMAQKSLEEFSNYILSHLPQFPPEYLDIKRVNIGLKEVDEETAIVLESGKNICALK